MNGQQLEACFGSGFSNIKFIRIVTLSGLSFPEKAVANPMADVQEQQHIVSAAFDGKSGTLTVSQDATGDGLWIPWLGQGSTSSNGKGWGTYTRAVTDKSWVATGPFSGCYAVAFANGPRFGHIVTPGGGYTVASVDGQINAIKAATGAGNPTKVDMKGNGLGYIFFMKAGAEWVYRRVFVGPASPAGVHQISGTSAKAF